MASRLFLSISIIALLILNTGCLSSSSGSGSGGGSAVVPDDDNNDSSSSSGSSDIDNSSSSGSAPPSNSDPDNNTSSGASNQTGEPVSLSSSGDIIFSKTEVSQGSSDVVVVPSGNSISELISFTNYSGGAYSKTIGNKIFRLNLDDQSSLLVFDADTGIESTIANFQSSAMWPNHIGASVFYNGYLFIASAATNKLARININNTSDIVEYNDILNPTNMKVIDNELYISTSIDTNQNTNLKVAKIKSDLSSVIWDTQEVLIGAFGSSYYNYRFIKFSNVVAAISLNSMVFLNSEVSYTFSSLGSSFGVVWQNEYTANGNLAYAYQSDSGIFSILDATNQNNVAITTTQLNGLTLPRYFNKVGNYVYFLAKKTADSNWYLFKLNESDLENPIQMIKFAADPYIVGNAIPLINAGTHLCIAGDDAEGIEVYCVDASGNLACLKDINDGANDSNPYQFYLDNGFLYFTANSSDGVRKIVKSDFTTQGTDFVSPSISGDDYYLNSELTQNPTNTHSGYVIKSNGDVGVITSGKSHILYSITDQSGDTAAWDVYFLASETTQGIPGDLVGIYGGKVFFSYQTNLGPQIFVGDTNPTLRKINLPNSAHFLGLVEGSSTSTKPRRLLVENNNNLYIVAYVNEAGGPSLVKVDITTETSTELVAGVNRGPTNLHVFNNEVYFESTFSGAQTDQRTIFKVTADDTVTRVDNNIVFKVHGDNGNATNSGSVSFYNINDSLIVSMPDSANDLAQQVSHSFYKLDNNNFEPILNSQGSIDSMDANTTTENTRSSGEPENSMWINGNYVYIRGMQPHSTKTYFVYDTVNETMDKIGEFANNSYIGSKTLVAFSVDGGAKVFTSHGVEDRSLTFNLGVLENALFQVQMISDAETYILGATMEDGVKIYRMHATTAPFVVGSLFTTNELISIMSQADSFCDADLFGNNGIDCNLALQFSEVGGELYTSYVKLKDTNFEDGFDVITAKFSPATGTFTEFETITHATKNSMIMNINNTNTNEYLVGNPTMGFNSLYQLVVHFDDTSSNGTVEYKLTNFGDADGPAVFGVEGVANIADIIN